MFMLYVGACCWIRMAGAGAVTLLGVDYCEQTAAFRWSGGFGSRIVVVVSGNCEAASLWTASWGTGGRK